MSGIAPGCDTTGDAGCASLPASGEDGTGSKAVGAGMVVGTPPSSVAAGAGLVPVSARLPPDGAPPSLVDPAVKTNEPTPGVPWGAALSPLEPFWPPASGDGPHPSARLEAKTEVDIRTHRVLRWSFMSYLLERQWLSRLEVRQSAKTWL